MSVTLKHKRAAISGNVPSSLNPGELALDEYTGKLFWHGSTDVVNTLPLLAPASTILGNNGAGVANPVFLTASQARTVLGVQPSDTATFTGTTTVASTIQTGISATRSYVIVAPVTGATVTIANTTAIQIINPTGLLAALTVALPSAPIDGQRIKVTITSAITLLAVTASGGATIKNGPTAAIAGLCFEYLYASSVNTWFKIT